MVVVLKFLWFVLALCWPIKIRVLGFYLLFLVEKNELLKLMRQIISFSLLPLTSQLDLPYKTKSKKKTQVTCSTVFFPHPVSADKWIKSQSWATSHCRYFQAWNMSVNNTFNWLDQKQIIEMVAHDIFWISQISEILIWKRFPGS